MTTDKNIEMMPYRAAELLIEKIKKDYSDDISVVVMMGSHLYQDTHHKSDLDLYFIPKTDRGYRLSTVFIIDDIGYDFWAISWERIARIAAHEEKLGSIITEGKVLYYGTKEDLDKFESFRNSALKTSDFGHFVWKAGQKIGSSSEDYLKLESSKTLTDVRYYGARLIYDITEALALLNRTPIKRGRGKLLGEMLKMPLLPTFFERDFRTLFTAKKQEEIKIAVTGLFIRTVAYVENVDAERLKGTFTEAAQDFYEEFINFYNKIERACQTGDYQTSLFVASEMRLELENALENRGVDMSDLPDLLEAYDSDNLDQLYRLSIKHKNMLEKMLRHEKVEIRRFSGERELKSLLDSL